LKPNITVYAKSGPDETKKLEGFISAAFWVGVDHAEGDVRSVKIRLPTESYDFDVENMLEFTSLLVRRQINFTVEFFVEPLQRQAATKVETKNGPEQMPGSLASGREPEADYEDELSSIKAQYEKGAMTKEQFEAKKGTLLKKWREGIEGRLNQ
jgi:hypothetical protein